MPDITKAYSELNFVNQEMGINLHHCVVHLTATECDLENIIMNDCLVTFHDVTTNRKREVVDYSGYVDKKKEQ